MSAEERLEELGITLPDAPKPAGVYVPAVRGGNLVFVAGQLPMERGELQFTGKLGEDIGVEKGYEAARLCALNVLSVLRSECGSLNEINRVVRACGYVRSADGFTDQSSVINGASELLNDVFGERGRHARLALGANELPLGAPVELEVIAEVR
jgi:enamine deaminase RidA (YjgF/YER057c/UK114 family)